MIATVTLNPSLDEHITVDGLIIDEANRWSKLKRYAGGKGIDVARAIHEMNGITVAYGFIGGSQGRTLEILLDEEGVQYSFTPIQQETRTNFIITDTKTYQQTRIGARGPHISKSELERFYRKLREIRPKPDLLVASGSLPPGVPDDIYYNIADESRKYGIRTVLDSEGVWLEEGIKAKPYLIKPNVYEAEELLKRDIPNKKAVIKAALDLVEMGTQIAIISRGKDGIIAASREEIIEAIPPMVKVRSALGAGDCTIAGLAIKLANNEPLIEACRLGVAMGTAAVLTPGTELCHRADVEKILPQVKVCKLTDS
ncbi:MAG: 1-phosphofructokinase [Dehalococcoidales bacterium]|nr:1-phosphofructokinase [Dehalococcoidales bacterium]